MYPAECEPLLLKQSVSKLGSILLAELMAILAVLDLVFKISSECECGDIETTEHLVLQSSQWEKLLRIQLDIQNSARFLDIQKSNYGYPKIE